MISNLSITKSILQTEFPNHNFSLIKLYKISREKNLGKYYIGKISKSRQRIIYDSNGKIISGIIPIGNKSLFINENDEYYYDVIVKEIKKGMIK